MPLASISTKKCFPRGGKETVSLVGIEMADNPNGQGQGQSGIEAVITYSPSAEAARP